MNNIADTLTIQAGPIAGHADGPVAIAALLAIILVYVFGAAVANELVRRISERKLDR
jgi:hypothetical protein